MPHQSDARNRCIVALWNRGESMTAIGRALGISRNVVAGVVQRARLRGEQVEARGAPANFAAAQKARPKPAKSPPKSHQWPAVSGPRLSDDPHDPVGCRWIEGDPGGIWSYCQRRALPLRSWCAAHRARVYRPRASKSGSDALDQMPEEAR